MGEGHLMTAFICGHVEATSLITTGNKLTHLYQSKDSSQGSVRTLEGSNNSLLLSHQRLQHGGPPVHLSSVFSVGIHAARQWIWLKTDQSSYNEAEQKASSRMPSCSFLAHQGLLLHQGLTPTILK